jgi:hypothetical protein
MKNFVLAAIAVLTLGIATASAQSLEPSNYPQARQSGLSLSGK